MADLISIGASATQVYRQALSTVSNNIANLNTEGYSRQEAITTENTPGKQGVHSIGTGSRLVAVKRNYDQFIEGNLRQSKSQLSAQNPMVDYSNRILDIMGDESSALTSALDRFFESVNKLAVDPGSRALRGSLLSAADYLSGRTHDIASQLAGVNDDSASALRTVVEKLNNLMGQLAQVNLELGKSSTLERQAPTLLDQRDNLLRDMADLANLKVDEAANGEVAVRLAGSSSHAWLVSRSDVRRLDVIMSPQDTASHAFVVDAYGAAIGISPPPGGELGGLVSFRGEVLSPLMQNMDRFAETFVREANTVHAAGSNLENQTGLDLFSIGQRIEALDSAGQLAGEVTVQSLRANPEPIEPLLVTYAGADQWLIQDGDGKDLGQIGGEQQNGSYTVRVQDLELRFAQVPEQGKSYLITAMTGSAMTMRVALDEPALVAAGGRLIAEAGINNQRAYDIEFDRLAEAAPLTSGTALADMPGRTMQIAASTRYAAPAISVAKDLSDFVVSFQPPVDSEQQLQVFTDDFVQLAGTEMDAVAIDQLQKSGAFKAASLYTNESLNAGDSGLFYGFRAEQAAISATIPRQLNTTGGVSELIAAGDLTLNGTALDALQLAADATLSAADIATWLNAQSEATGVTASAENSIRIAADSLNYQNSLVLNGVTVFAGLNVGEDGEPQQLVSAINANIDESGVEAWLDAEGYLNLRNRPGAEGENILLGSAEGLASLNSLGWEETLVTGKLRLEGEQIAFGFSDPASDRGRPADLSRLGLATGIYGNGRRDSNLQVYVSDSTSTSTQLTVSVGSLLPPAPPSNERSYSIVFGDDGDYELRDLSTGDLLRKAVYDHDSGIALLDSQVRFDLQPQAGERFEIRPNLDASGDNRTLLALIGLAEEPLIDDMTAAQFYVDQVSKVGTVSQLSQLSRDALQVVYDQAEESRARVSGVSLDQEAADLIRFQQAYQAAAQVIQVSTRLFDAILGVGR
ncbi:MAG: flagellar hook-associated protein FlgK [Proteobacteria bacterium]|nr:flagellar hook-associated protein FlgK [Pseudomonadota bacterium]MDA0928087.1 flagellar hook-associated protein FlgK [Pseudomonadota bacterium]